MALDLSGEMTQGGWIRGQLPIGTVQADLGGTVISFDADRQFFAAFDRDAGPRTFLSVSLQNGSHLAQEISVSPRAWNIEQVDASPTANVPSEAFMARRKPELERIAAARQVESGSQGWRQNFVWPATGRISGRFGSQRVYRGEPGSYHSGIDIAGGTGTSYVAPADGVVVLAAESPFTLEGNLLIIDHGMGLSSAFLHSSELLVHTGEAVKQGQLIGRIGATGRATGPHLHWGLVWRGARLDPLLFTGPMP
ncbi:M23 family metallopeptidase [Altererythrobacter sp. Root672]|uniref:M23 family metallopeptidase n=1 Tax=Altererythrobacter sp. Root672 TaxID=1736584 RepID=UPI0009ECA14E|nr:M23 family metallopeptidase [Altererythrobacter sp. Root672]